jgi:hypothetical protein
LFTKTTSLPRQDVRLLADRRISQNESQNHKMECRGYMALGYT